MPIKFLFLASILCLWLDASPTPYISEMLEEANMKQISICSSQVNRLGKNMSISSNSLREILEVKYFNILPAVDYPEFLKYNFLIFLLFFVPQAQ